MDKYLPEWVKSRLPIPLTGEFFATILVLSVFISSGFSVPSVSAQSTLPPPIVSDGLPSTFSGVQGNTFLDPITGGLINQYLDPQIYPYQDTHQVQTSPTQILPDGSLVDVQLSPQESSVSGIGTAQTPEFSVIATIPVDDNPLRVAVDPTNSLLYVTIISNVDDVFVGNVFVIDISTNTVIATIPGFGNPVADAVNPTNGLAYVSDELPFTVSVIDPSTKTVIATIPVGSIIGGIAVNLTNGLIYVTATRCGGCVPQDSVSVIDPATNTVVDTIPVGLEPEGIDVNPTNGLVYVANMISATVSVIDTSTNTVIATVPVDSLPEDVAVNPISGLAYVVNPSSDTISVIDPSTNTVVDNISVENNGKIAVNPTNGLVYVTNSDPGTVSVIDTSTNTVIATGPVDAFRSSDVAVNPISGLAYVTTSGPDSDTVSVISSGSQPPPPPTDITPPVLSSISAVDGNNAPVANLSSTSSTSIQFTFEFVDDVGVAGVECSLDGSPFSACTSPLAYDNLASDTTHTFQVRATDTTGNTNPTPASFIWTVEAETFPPMPPIPFPQIPQPTFPELPPITFPQIPQPTFPELPPITFPQIPQPTFPDLPPLFPSGLPTIVTDSQ